MLPLSPLECRYCRAEVLGYEAQRAHAVTCDHAPWNRQPGWQVAAPTSSRWIQFRLWLSNRLRRR